MPRRRYGISDLSDARHGLLKSSEHLAINVLLFVRVLGNERDHKRLMVQADKSLTRWHSRPYTAFPVV
jgi:hypothetical protein